MITPKTQGTGATGTAATLLINVAVIPPSTIVDELAALSVELRDRGGRYALNGTSHRAHLTVYMARFHRTSVARIRAMFLDVGSAVGPGRMVHSGYHLTDGNYYEASYVRSADLMAAHRSMRDSLAPLRFSPGKPVVEDYFGPYTAAQKDNAERYGYDLAENLYRPHITITSFSERPAVPLPTARADLSFAATQLGLFIADRTGAVGRELARFAVA
jgi:hypothetical protein